MAYNIKDIKCTFQYAQFLSKYSFFVLFTIFGISFFVTLIAFLYCFISQQELKTTLGVAFCMTISIIGLTITFLTLIIQKKRTAKIELWLADRELIERKVIPFIISEKSDFLYRSVKISVKFTYKNRKLTKTSEKCRPCFRLIAHKEVSILYSPTYDQVMVLK